MIAAYHELEATAYRVFYIVDGIEHQAAGTYLGARSAADEAWTLRRAGLTAWIEEEAR